MMVSSRSQMNTLSVAGSGTCCAGDEDVLRRPRPRERDAVLSPEFSLHLRLAACTSVLMGDSGLVSFIDGSIDDGDSDKAPPK